MNYLLANTVYYTQAYQQAHTCSSTMPSCNTSGGLAIFLFVFIFALLFVVLAWVGLWKLFTKAGRPGWAAIVPVYNLWVLFEISGKPGAWSLTILLAVIPFLGVIPFLVLWVLAMLELAKKFGKSTAFAVVGLILFQLIGILILGFGSAQYNQGEQFTGTGSAPTPPVGTGPSETSGAQATINSPSAPITPPDQSPNEPPAPPAST